MGLAGLYAGTPMQFITPAVLSFTMIGPFSWWIYKTGKLNPARASNIFYENNTTADEIERFRHQDMIENIGIQMRAEPGFGYHNLADPKTC
jgi:hypothetical protein